MHGLGQKGGAEGAAVGGEAVVDARGEVRPAKAGDAEAIGAAVAVPKAIILAGVGYAGTLSAVAVVGASHTSTVGRAELRIRAQHGPAAGPGLSTDPKGTDQPIGAATCGERGHALVIVAVPQRTVRPVGTAFEEAVTAATDAPGETLEVRVTIDGFTAEGVGVAESAVDAYAVRAGGHADGGGVVAAAVTDAVAVGGTVRTLDAQRRLANLRPSAGHSRPAAIHADVRRAATAQAAVPVREADRGGSTLAVDAGLSTGAGGVVDTGRPAGSVQAESPGETPGLVVTGRGFEAPARARIAEQGTATGLHHARGLAVAVDAKCTVRTVQIAAADRWGDAAPIGARLGAGAHGVLDTRRGANALLTSATRQASVVADAVRRLLAATGDRVTKERAGARDLRAGITTRAAITDPRTVAIEICVAHDGLGTDTLDARLSARAAGVLSACARALAVGASPVAFTVEVVHTTGCGLFAATAGRVADLKTGARGLDAPDGAPALGIADLAFSALVVHSAGAVLDTGLVQDIATQTGSTVGVVSAAIAARAFEAGSGRQTVRVFRARCGFDAETVGAELRAGTGAGRREVRLDRRRIPWVEACAPTARTAISHRVRRAGVPSGGITRARTRTAFTSATRQNQTNHGGHDRPLRLSLHNPFTPSIWSPPGRYCSGVLSGFLRPSGSCSCPDQASRPDIHLPRPHQAGAPLCDRCERRWPERPHATASSAG